MGLPQRESRRWIRRRESALFGNLEQRAKSVTGEGRTRPAWGEAPFSSLERDIALVMGHIGETRALHHRQRDELLRLEVWIDNELIAMHHRTPKYSPRRFPEHEKLERRLMGILAQRRSLDWNYAGQMADLQRRLLTLLNQHALVGEEGDDRD